MGRVSLALWLVAAFGSTAAAILHRHDVPAEQFVVDGAEFPAVVDLLEPGDCLATLVDPEWLLTAAHCAVDLRDEQTFAIGEERVGLRWWTVHERSDGFAFDIALVRLDREVTVPPVPLRSAPDAVGDEVVFVGRGDHGTGDVGERGASLDGQTRRATNTIDLVDERLIGFTFHAPDDPGATALEGISGPGDSGGPAFVREEGELRLAGISSYQEDARRAGTYGARERYTRVFAFRDWIADGIAGELPEVHALQPEGCSAAAGSSGAWLFLVVLVPMRRLFAW